MRKIKNISTFIIVIPFTICGIIYLSYQKLINRKDTSRILTKFQTKHNNFILIACILFWGIIITSILK